MSFPTPRWPHHSTCEGAADGLRLGEDRQTPRQGEGGRPGAPGATRHGLNTSAGCPRRALVTRGTGRSRSPYPIAYRSIVPRAAESPPAGPGLPLLLAHPLRPISMEPVSDPGTVRSDGRRPGAARRRDGPGVDITAARPFAQDRQVLGGTAPPRPGRPRYQRGPEAFKGVALYDAKPSARRVLPSVRALEREIARVNPRRQRERAAPAHYTPNLPARAYEIILYSPPTTGPKLRLREGRRELVGALNRNRATGRRMVSMGKFRLPRGRGTAVMVSNEGTDGYVVADGIQFLPLG